MSGFMATNNIIILNRGDTYQFDLVIDDTESPDGIYRLKGNDTVYLGIMDPHQPFEQALVKKRFTAEDMTPNGVLTIVITAEDTLELLPGAYYYAVKIHMQHEKIDHKTVMVIDQVNTIINKTKFFICD